MSYRKKKQTKDPNEIAVEQDNLPFKDLSNMRIQALSLSDIIPNKIYNTYEKANALGIMEAKAAKVLDVIENKETPESVMMYINEMKQFYEEYIKPDQMLALKSQIFIDNVLSEISKDPLLSNALTLNISSKNVSSKNLKRVGLTEIEREIINSNKEIIRQNALLLKQLERLPLTFDNLEESKKLASDTVALIETNKEIEKKAADLPPTDPSYSDEVVEEEYTEDANEMLQVLSTIDDQTPIKQKPTLDDPITDQSQEKLNKLMDYELNRGENFTVGEMKESIKSTRPGIFNKILSSLFAKQEAKEEPSDEENFQSFDATPQSEYKPQASHHEADHFEANEGDDEGEYEYEEEETNRKLNMNDNDTAARAKPETIVPNTETVATNDVANNDDVHEMDNFSTSVTQPITGINALFESLSNRIEKEKSTNSTYQQPSHRKQYIDQINNSIKKIKKSTLTTAEQSQYDKFMKAFEHYTNKEFDKIEIPESNENVMIKSMEENFGKLIKKTIKTEGLTYQFKEGRSDPVTHTMANNSAPAIIMSAANAKLLNAPYSENLADNPKSNFTQEYIANVLNVNELARSKMYTLNKNKPINKTFITNQVPKVLTLADKILDANGAEKERLQKKMFDEYGVVVFEGEDIDFEFKLSTGKGNTLPGENNTRFQKMVVSLLVHIKDTLEGNPQAVQAIDRRIIQIPANPDSETNQELLKFALRMIEQYILPISTYLATGSHFATFFAYAMGNKDNISGLINSMTNLFSTLGNGVLNTGTFFLNAINNNAERNLNNARADFIREQTNQLRGQRQAPLSITNNNDDSDPDDDDNAEQEPEREPEREPEQEITSRQLFFNTPSAAPQSTPQTIAQRVAARKKKETTTKKKGKAYVPTAMPSNSQHTLDKYGNLPIDNIFIQRRPIQQFVGKIYTQILPYDELYHLGIVVQINGQYIVLEKVPHLSIKEIPSLDPQAEIVQVSPPFKPNTLHEIVKGLRIIMGNGLYAYDAFQNNCQVFVASFLAILDKLREHKEFVLQDKIQGAHVNPIVKKATRLVTDLGSLISGSIMGGSN